MGVPTCASIDKDKAEIGSDQTDEIRPHPPPAASASRREGGVAARKRVKRFKRVRAIFLRLSALLRRTGLNLFVNVKEIVCYLLTWCLWRGVVERVG